MAIGKTRSDMQSTNIFQEAGRFQENPGDHKPRRLIQADCFSVKLFVHHAGEKARLHTCGNDEFFFVVKGEVEMLVEGQSIFMKEGDGLLVKANEKHTHRLKEGALMTLVTHEPHQHRYFENVQ
jgi:mannose-6-phosphate isomerase-like protein (cupin superfamily)